MARRRDVLVGAAALAAAAMFSVQAQPRARVWRVGWLGTSSRESSREWNEAFVGAMRQLGYVEGRNLSIEWRHADGDYRRLAAFAAEFVALQLDVLVASSSPAISAAKRATSTIPIVMGVTADPIGAGFVKSLAEPGGNVTGSAVPVTDYTGKHLEFLKRLLPEISHVAVFTNPSNIAHKRVLKGLEATARELGVRLARAEARNPAEIGKTIVKHALQGAQAIIVLPDALLLQQRDEIAKLALEHRLPTTYQLKAHVEAGGLMSYGHDLSHNFRVAATYVDRILRGAKPAHLPVEMTSKFELVLNRRTARALGIAIPPDLAFLADKVID